MWDVKEGMIKSVKYEDQKGTKILYLRKYIGVDNVEQLEELGHAIDVVSKYLANSKLAREEDEK
jgi:hypothetical protein